MSKFNVSEAITQAEKAYGLGSGEYFKVKEGANKIRLMTNTVPHQSTYKGTKTFKHVCWILDYKDMKVKLYFMPHTILKAIEALQLSEDYSFTDVPMPYDVTINAKNAGTKEVDYQLMPARLATEITADALHQLNEKHTIQDVVAKLVENEKERVNVDPNLPPAPVAESEIDVSSIPF